MADVVLLIFTALAVLSILLGLASLLGGVRFRALVRATTAKGWPPYAPPVAVVVACKGVDPGLEQTLQALMRQDYPSFRVVFALDDLEDPAHGVIRTVTGGSESRTTVIAAKPVPSATGKAAALIAAARTLAPRDEVVAFLDSDARPRHGWLRTLVAPLQDGTVGATTAYRWYVHDWSLASATRAAWNAAGTNLMFDDRRNFAWGGSYAIRRETFDRALIPAKWGSALSDDMVVTQAVKGLGLRVAYVPAATVVTDEPTDWRSMLEWVTRQTVMMRAYDPRVTRYAAAAYATVAGSVDLGIALAAIAVIANPVYAIPALLLLGHVPLLAAKALLRLSVFRRITAARLGPTGAFVLGSLVVPWLTLYALSAARRIRLLSWRGTVYELAGPPPIRVVRR